MIAPGHGGGEGESGTHTQHARPPVPCAPRKSSNVLRPAQFKMADSIFSRKQMLKRFITLYKEQDCLWNKMTPGYKQKQQRDEAVGKLTALVQEYDPGATKVHVLRKIESLRACVRREYKRVLESRMKAKSADEVYIPNLWYYNLLSFVFGEDGSNCKLKHHSPAQSPAQDEDSEEELAEEDSYEPLENYAAEYNVETSMIEVDSNRRYFEDEPKKRCEIDDEYDAIGVNVAAKLRTLPANMRILAEKLINDVLFQAQMQGLSSTTVISTPDPFK